MNIRRCTLLIMLSCFFTAAVVQAQFAASPGSARFEQQATVLHSMYRYDGDAEVQLIRKPKSRNLEIRFVRDDKIVLSIPAHSGTVFKEVKGVLYYASFSESRSGCTIIAYNLQNQKKLWRSELQALGSVSHSAYSNMVTIDANEEFVWVYGQESYGNYFEKLDVKSGKTIVNKKLK